MENIIKVQKCYEVINLLHTNISTRRGLNNQTQLTRESIAIIETY